MLALRPVRDSRGSSVRAIVITACASVVVSCGVPEPEQAADLVLSGGNVVTMNEAAPSAEAIAVQGDRILAVGTTEEIGPFIGSDTRVKHGARRHGARAPIDIKLRRKRVMRSRRHGQQPAGGDTSQLAARG